MSVPSGILGRRRRHDASVADPNVPTSQPPAPHRRPGPGRRFGRRWFDNRLLPMLLVTPAMLLIFGLVGYPIVRTFWLSFTDADLSALAGGGTSLSGVDNYAQVLTDPLYRRVFLTTVVFGLACVAGTMVLGVASALLLNQRFRGRMLLSVLVVLPWAMPKVAGATVWEWLFHDQYGVVNWLLVSVGLQSFEGFAWFTSRLPAFTAIGTVVVWQSFPFVALLVLAGLQSVPEDLHDAARIDGASAWQRLRHVTLPLLKPLLLVLTVISTIWDFKIFDQVYVMTSGGPARSTEVLSITVWREAFTQFEFGLAAALAVAMFAVLLVVTVIYIRLVREEEGLT